VRGFRLFGKANALAKMASCRLGCWIIRVSRPWAPVGTLPPRQQSISTGPRLSPQPEALRHESNDGTDAIQEHAQTAREAKTITVVFRASMLAKHRQPQARLRGSTSSFLVHRSYL
jgi:hypothetical protein